MPYLYRLEGRWETPDFLGYKRGDKEGKLHVIFEGRLNDLKLLHRFDIPSGEPYIDETLILQNETSEPIGSSRPAMGFARSIGMGDKVEEDLRKCRMVSVPFMRDLRGRREEYKDYSFGELLINECPD